MHFCDVLFIMTMYHSRRVTTLYIRRHILHVIRIHYCKCIVHGLHTPFRICTTWPYTSKPTQKNTNTIVCVWLHRMGLHQQNYTTDMFVVLVIKVKGIVLFYTPRGRCNTLYLSHFKTHLSDKLLHIHRMYLLVMHMCQLQQVLCG